MRTLVRPESPITTRPDSTYKSGKVVQTTGATSAYASKSADNDALAVTGAKISLIQAVTAAEQHVGGKASRAEYERHDGQWIFEVEVVKESKVTDVKIDPTNARIIASAEDKRDHQDSDDREKSDR